ncbi:MAG: V-type ATPase subunit [bacterium]|nr:MAG: V-type ATPase subunit [bacterium]
MVEYIDYINARIRGMMARLMSEERLRQTTESATVSDWVASLRETPYTAELGGSVPFGDSGALMAAVDRSTAARTHRLSRIASGRPATALSALLAEWDLKNLQTLISGLHYRAKPEQILSSTIAGGVLDQDQLEVLARSSSLREAADRLVTWHYPYAKVFKRAIGRDDRPLIDMRLELTRGLVGHIRLIASGSGFPSLMRYLGDRVDQMNLMTALMWRTLPTDRGPEGFYLEKGGELTPSLYLRVIRASDVGEIALMLPRGILKNAVRKASVPFDLGGRSSVFQQALDRELHRAYTRLRDIDPLDMSLLIAYLLNLYREGILLKLALLRIFMGISPGIFQEVVGDV